MANLLLKIVLFMLALVLAHASARNVPTDQTKPITSPTTNVALSHVANVVENAPTANEFANEKNVMGNGPGLGAWGGADGWAGIGAGGELGLGLGGLGRGSGLGGPSGGSGLGAYGGVSGGAEVGGGLGVGVGVGVGSGNNP